MVELQEELLARLASVQGFPLNNTKEEEELDDLIDNLEVKNILNISTSTLYRIKKSERITPIRIGKRNYYSKTEINKIIKHFMR